ncbi:hypothetical protein HHK36_023017 [Tetracentron sinense]|uniref:F-box/LRR-repeat protein 15-like leucin rich repeat domain-containing protein n=1 Tax=Tetracentron sinense TaxID=13715 RepID=A0A835D6V2_TETSI|nr:hypothetical protein HHK36_023017 [Tetracentron sinense]
MSSPSILFLFTEDLLLKILDKITDTPDRKTWRLVCKDFLRVESVHRKSLRVFRDESLPGLLRRYEAIELLDLSFCPRIDDCTVALAFGGESSGWTRRLRSLVLCRATGLRSAGLELVVRSCPCLEEIDVSYCCRFGDREASALSLAKGLRNLKLDKCLGITDVGLAKIAVGCVTNKSLQSIASLLKLEVLSMVGCSFVDDDGLQFLRTGNPSLKSIDVSRCDSVGSSGLISVISEHKGLLQISAGYCFPELGTPILRRLKDLKVLNSIRIDGARVSDLGIQIISVNCKHLIEIGLSKCIGVTDVAIADLVSDNANLKTLDLTCCHSITDVALSAIGDSCKKLICLKLESCSLITEKGLDRLGSSCSQLEELDLTDCSGVNDTGLKYLSRCAELVYLKLGLCANISDKGLIHIGSNCPKLHELDLYRCTGIGDDGLAAISSGCKKLKKLNLSYCIHVTDRGMKHISSLEELWDLEMRRLVNITSTGLTVVAAGCKSLAVLDLKQCPNINDSCLWGLAQYSRNLRQINVSYCPVSDVGLCMLMGNLRCLQDAKLVLLTHVSLEGFELVLRASCDRLKKVKLLGTLRYLLSPELLQTLQARGCKIRWD